VTLTVHTLKKRTEFLRLKSAKPFHQPLFTMRAVPQQQSADISSCRVGLTVSNYCSKKAVERNRIKRRLRAVVRQIWPDYGRAGFDYVLIAKIGCLHASYDELKAATTAALSRLHTNA
jgi:ribonuclease P protein component